MEQNKTVNCSLTRKRGEEMYSFGNPLGDLGSRGYSDPDDWEDDDGKKDQQTVGEPRPPWILITIFFIGLILFMVFSG